MKHMHDGFSGIGLPDAPLAMPKQQLERRVSLFSALRSMFFSRQRA
jgi:hypothetical protein